VVRQTFRRVGLLLGVAFPMAASAIPAPGDVNIVISCVGPTVNIERAPDVKLVMTCNGLAQLVGIKAPTKNDQPLRLVADDTVRWAINASVA
jgi:hypothetical protein